MRTPAGRPPRACAWDARAARSCGASGVAERWGRGGEGPMPPGLQALCAPGARALPGVAFPPFVDAGSGASCSLTVVGPPGPGPAGARLHAAFRAIVACAASLRAAGASPPARVDAVVMLHGARKRLPRPGEPVRPADVNTGLCALSGGSALVLVYRSEEAVKTLAHEVLHAFRVGAWCDADPLVARRARALAAAFLGRPPPSVPRLLPSEAVVDAVAIGMCLRLFGGASEARVARHARGAASSLAAHLAGVRGPPQATPAIEYYAVKLHLLRPSPCSLFDACRESEGASVAAVLAALAAPPEAPAPGPRPRGMRMTPPGLAGPPALDRALREPERY